MRRPIQLAGALAALLALAAPAAAGDAPNPQREVALLEFRAGSEALASVGARSARILGEKTSLSLIEVDEARQRYGGELDARLVACSGEPSCVAEIGEAIGADEILLLGVSEFGDVILAVQRIDVSDKKVSARMAEALAPGSEPDDQRLERYLRRVFPKSDFRRFGMIRIEANVEGAEVRVGSEPRGKTPLRPLKLRAPATYEIELSKPGYTDFSARVAVPPDGEVEVRPELSRRASDAWYKKWWVLAIAGTVAAGATTAAVLATRDGGGVDVQVAPF